MRAAIRPDTRLLWIANPNNPTGTFLPYPQLRAFLQSLPAEVVVVLDEAYNEYLPPAERVDTTAWLAAMPNLVITRTFSKIYGLAGLRIGYALCSAEIADLMNRVRQPFNCNNLALVAAIAALDDHEFVASSYALNRSGMAQIVGGLKRLGCTHIPSHGNFVTFRWRMRSWSTRSCSTGGHRSPDRRLRDAGMAACHDRHRKRKYPFPRRPGGVAVSSACAGIWREQRAAVRKVVVFGVGLIGGSFALALKAAGQVRRGRRFRARIGSLTQALELGIVDRAGFNVGQEVSNADLVLIATPVGKTAGDHGPHCPLPGTPDAGHRRGQYQGKRHCRSACPFCCPARAIRPRAPHRRRRKQRCAGRARRPLLPQAGSPDAAAGKPPRGHRPRRFGLGVLRWRPGQGTDGGRA
jgi:hypothetical protein